MSSLEPGGPADSLIRPGQQFKTVLLGMPLGDRISLFHDDGTITTHSVPSDADLGSRIGRGSIARTEVGDGFRREAALWDETSSMLLLTSRFGRGDSVAADGLVLSAPLPLDQARADPDIAEVHLHLNQVARTSAAAGEAVYLSRGGWTAPPNEEYVLFVAIRSPTGEAMSHIEAFPPPGPGTIWDVFENRQPEKASIVRSPLEGGMDGVGPLLFAAAQFCPPNELALSYIPATT